MILRQSLGFDTRFRGRYGGVVVETRLRYLMTPWKICRVYRHDASKICRESNILPVVWCGRLESAVIRVPSSTSDLSSE
ncbi:hypothetical protein AVEN_8132-1 [Araneus ventricosus]|uniref:Uncharacterized protein n=1 Tax=Araneus ventricosus TaxID=182803 RepID=A0A4Y2QX43_ARAVE|nr:hypothetical protein AVEN_8132-1 [Araneus ventricosus]